MQHIHESVSMTDKKQIIDCLRDHEKSSIVV
jgi:hypothetical protein